MIKQRTKHRFRVGKVVMIKGLGIGQIERLTKNKHGYPCYSVRVLDNRLDLFGKLYGAPDWELRNIDWRKDR